MNGIECKRVISRPKNLFEMEIILDECKTAPAELVDLLTEYNRQLQIKEGPALLKDVYVNGFYKSKNICGHNQEHSAFYNPNGIYFWGTVARNKVVFELPRKNLTKAWLEEFCKQYVKKKE
jgi:hypothetical protein